MNMYFDFNNPTRILFGRGKLNELGESTDAGEIGNGADLQRKINQKKMAIWTEHWNNFITPVQKTAGLGRDYGKSFERSRDGGSRLCQRKSL